MYGSKALLLSALVALLSVTTAAPAPAANTTEDASLSGGCIVPEIAFNTINEPFTLTAVTNKPADALSVILPAFSAKKAGQPFITRTRIAQPLFRLTDGKLTTGGPKYKKFPAYFGPTILIFPPVLQPLLFGGVDTTDTTGTEFFAGYTCDAQGKIYLELRTIERKSPSSSNSYAGSSLCLVS